MQLAFSDEFNAPGRSFAVGAGDERWTADNLWYAGTDDMEVYTPSQVTTKDGAAVITMERGQAAGLSQRPDGAVWNVTKDFKSGFFSSWNKVGRRRRCGRQRGPARVARTAARSWPQRPGAQPARPAAAAGPTCCRALLPSAAPAPRRRCHASRPREQFCFTGGYLEAALQFPGDDYISGFWPAFWLMGNLARPGAAAAAAAAAAALRPGRGCLRLRLRRCGRGGGHGRRGGGMAGEGGCLPARGGRLRRLARHARTARPAALPGP